MAFDTINHGILLDDLSKKNCFVVVSVPSDRKVSECIARGLLFGPNAFCLLVLNDTIFLSLIFNMKPEGKVILRFGQVV